MGNRIGRRKRSSAGGRWVRGRKPWLLRLLVGASAVLVAGLVVSVAPYWRLSATFQPLPQASPSRAYSRPFRLYPDQRLTLEGLVERLRRIPYHPAGERGLLPGQYAISGLRVAILRRRFRAPGSDGGGGLLVVWFERDRVARLELDGRSVSQALVEPELLGSWYGAKLLEVRPTPLSEIPADVIRAVLAAEDAGFFQHPGISLGGIARALWANWTGGEIRQGGSTITQQLAKNLYLTSERTWGRKLREAVLAAFLEWRYSKHEILEGYLNRIFWGRSGSANLIGIGAASWAYFGKRPEELNLAEGALLAGILPAPTEYSPFRNPEAARRRRDTVLERMVQLGWLARAEAEAAAAFPPPEERRPLTARQAPHFLDSVAAELRDRYGIQELRDTGWEVVTTLDPLDQEQAEVAAAQGLAELDRDRSLAKAGSLEVALISLDPATGAVLAWVGGRDWSRSQFDRVSQARRQAGSAFKPLVYAAAFEAGTATPASWVEDAPIEITTPAGLWRPMNDDETFRGWVTVREALEKSLNLPTVRIAQQTGLESIVGLARRCGIASPLRPVPSLALGSLEITPLELGTVYATFAARGVRPSTHRILSVSDSRGQKLRGAPAEPPIQALSTTTAYLVTSILQGVLDRGTAQRARSLGLTDPLAGKTGTTNRGRDSWFAGYSPERATVVWVGRDDDQPTRLSGSRAALPIFVRFIQAVRPPGGFLTFSPPQGVRVVLIDPASGGLATDRCPEVRTEAFPEDRIPQYLCQLHGSWTARPLEPEVAPPSAPIRGLRAWLRRLFGGSDSSQDRQRP